MSQMPGPQPAGNQNTPRPLTRDNRDKSRYEGFEGMNYEQRRQPFQPDTARNTEKNPPKEDKKPE